MRNGSLWALGAVATAFVANLAHRIVSGRKAKQEKPSGISSSASLDERVARALAFRENDFVEAQRLLHAHMDEITVKIAENTEISTDAAEQAKLAQHEANNAKVKLESVNANIERIEESNRANLEDQKHVAAVREGVAREQQNRMEATGQDTQRRVIVIEGTIIPVAAAVLPVLSIVEDTRDKVDSQAENCKAQQDRIETTGDDTHRVVVGLEEAIVPVVALIDPEQKKP